jgi:hypothetical protein
MRAQVNSSEDLRKAQGSTTSSSARSGKNIRGMNIWKKVIDLALYLAASAMAGTGLLLGYRLPHGAGNASRVVFFGYGRHEWGEIHTWLAYFALLLGMIHLSSRGDPSLLKPAVAREGCGVKTHLGTRRRYSLGGVHRWRFSLASGRKIRAKRQRLSHTSESGSNSCRLPLNWRHSLQR